MKTHCMPESRALRHIAPEEARNYGGDKRRQFSVTAELTSVLMSLLWDHPHTSEHAQNSFVGRKVEKL